MNIKSNFISNQVFPFHFGKTSLFLRVCKLWQSNPMGKFIAKIFRTAFYSCLLMKTNNSKLQIYYSYTYASSYLHFHISTHFIILQLFSHIAQESHSLSVYNVERVYLSLDMCRTSLETEQSGWHQMFLARYNNTALVSAIL